MRRKLGEILLEEGLLDEFQLQAALGHQRQWGGRLGEIVVGKEFCTAEGVADCLAKQMGLPRTALAASDIDPRAAQLVPVEMAERHGLVPFALEGTASDRMATLVIATADPTDLAALDEVQFRTGKRVRAAVATEDAVRATIRHVYHGAPLRAPGAPKGAAAPAPAAPAPAPSGPAPGAPRAIPLPDEAPESPLGAGAWDLDAGVSALSGAAAAPPTPGLDAYREIDGEALEEVEAVPVGEDGEDLDADLDALGFGAEPAKPAAAPAPPAAPQAPPPAAAPAPPRPKVDDAHARAILDAIDALADGASVPAAVQRYVNPTQMVAALIRLLIRQGVIDESAFLEELHRK